MIDIVRFHQTQSRSRLSSQILLLSGCRCIRRHRRCRRRGSSCSAGSSSRERNVLARLLALLAAAWVGVDPAVPGELVGAGEAFGAVGEGASVRLLACVGADVTGLVFEPIESSFAKRALIWSSVAVSKLHSFLNEARKLTSGSGSYRQHSLQRVTLAFPFRSVALVMPLLLNRLRWMQVTQSRLKAASQRQSRFAPPKRLLRAQLIGALPCLSLSALH